MALTERDRSVLYQRLNEVVRDEEAVGAMLSNFPTRDDDRPATKDFVDARIAHVRADFAELKTDLKTDFADLRTEMVSIEKRLTTFVHEEIRSSMRWTIGFVISAQAALVAAVAVFN